MRFRSLVTVVLSYLFLTNQLYAFDFMSDPRFKVSYQTGHFISIDRDYLDFNLFMPVAIDNLWLFADADGYRFNDGKWGASTGVGVRAALIDETVIGLNAYYDFLRGRGRHHFHQAGIGFEMLADCFDVRVNGYLPLSKKVRTYRYWSYTYPESNFHVSRRYLEYACGGVDAEIGKSLFSAADLKIYAAAGPYYFYRREFRHFFGGYARLGVDWKSIISLGVQASYDKHHTTRIQGIFAFSIPLDFCKIGKTCEGPSIFLQSVRRNGVILTEHLCDWRWNW